MTAFQSPASPVRVALLLPGRLLMYSHGWMSREFVDEVPPGIAVDVFVCTWNKVGPNSDADLDAEELARAYRPTKVRIVEVADAVPEPTDRDGDTGPLSSRCENQWLMVRRCFELMDEHARASGRTYDYVIRARLDVSIRNFPWARLLRFIDRNHVVPNLRRLSDRVLYFGGSPEHENSVWISDQFAVGSPGVMRIYCGLFDSLAGFYKDDVMKRIAGMCKATESPNPRGFWFGAQNHLFLTYHLYLHHVPTSALEGCAVTIHRRPYQQPPPRGRLVDVGRRPRGLLKGFFVGANGLWEYASPRVDDEREAAAPPASRSRALTLSLAKSRLGRRVLTAARRVLGRRVPGSFERL